MPHVRTSLRTALAAQLASVTGATVLMERRHRLGDDDLPAVTVSLTDTEPQDSDFSMGKPVQVDAQQTIAVEIHVQGVTGLGCVTELDAIEVEVEAAIAADVTAGGLLENIMPASSSLTFDPDQDRVHAVRSIEYIAMWRHPFGAPDAPEG